MACALAFCRWLTGQPIRPQQVLLQGEPPADLEPFQQVFQAPLKFNAGHYALRFERTDLDRPLPTANGSLAQLHGRFAGEYLARFAESRVSHQARQVLCRWFAITPREYRALVVACPGGQRSMPPEAGGKQHQYGNDLQATEQHAGG